MRKQGDRIRITAQLIKVEDGFHVWSQNFDRELDDIFAVQDEISSAIAQALSTRLVASGADASAPPVDIDPRAYDTYLRARQVLADRNAANLVKAAELFAQVSKAAPDFDLAWSGRAKAIALQFSYSGGDAGDSRASQARQAAETALKLNPRNAEALSMLAILDANYHWRFDDALREIREAISIAPNDAEVANFAGDTFRSCGALNDALAWEQRAVELDPLADFNHSDLGWVLLTHRRFREALAAGERALELDPNYWPAHDMRARAYLGLRDDRAALQETEALARVQPGMYVELELRARAALMRGDTDKARGYLQQLQARAAKGETLDYVIATVQAKLGDHDDAAESLARAVDKRDPGVPAEVEFIHPSNWPPHPGIQAFFARPEVATLVALRQRPIAPPPAAPAP